MHRILMPVLLAATAIQPVMAQDGRVPRERGFRSAPEQVERGPRPQRVERRVERRDGRRAEQRDGRRAERRVDRAEERSGVRVERRSDDRFGERVIRQADQRAVRQFDRRVERRDDARLARGGDGIDRNRDGRIDRYYDRNRNGQLDRRWDRNNDERLDRRWDRDRDGSLDRRWDRNDNERVDRRYDRNRDGFVDRRRFDGRRFDDRRFDGRRWDHGWRADRRYDWKRYRNFNRHVYRSGRYRPPYGYYNRGYRRFSIGIHLGAPFFGSSYWINDPWQFRLPAAYGPYRWVRYYDDVLLIDIRNGYVVDVIHDFFW